MNKYKYRKSVLSIIIIIRYYNMLSLKLSNCIKHISKHRNANQCKPHQIYINVNVTH